MKNRILVVEDIPENRSTYRITLELDNYLVDCAGSKEEALALIRERTYHAALVDIRLFEADESNTDGLDVVRALNSSGEGTKSVILSGHGSLENAIRAYESLGIFRFLQKESGTASLQEIRHAVAACVKISKINLLGKYPSLIALLAGGVNVAQIVWEGKCLHALKSGGAEMLKNAFHTLLDGYLPVLPLAEGNTSEIRDLDGCVRFWLWSKAARSALIGSLERASGVIKPTTLLGSNKEVRRFTKEGLIGVLCEDSQRKREDYVESIWH